MAHIGGDGVQMRVSRAKLGYPWESPAGNLRWVFVEEISSISDLNAMELRKKIDVLYCSVVPFFPIGGVHAGLVEIL